MHLIRHSDPQSFLERAGLWLAQHEVENNLIVGISHRLIGKGSAGWAGCYFATVEEGDHVVACVIRTPPQKAIITQAGSQALGLIVEDLANHDRSLPAVLGPEPDVRHFAELWGQRTGTSVRPGMKQRIFEIHRLKPLTRHPNGNLRVALQADVPRLVGWTADFLAETGGTGEKDFVRIVGERIAEQTLFVWEDLETVSMVGCRSTAATAFAVNLVYTPPAQRARGYASAAVSAVTAMFLARGYAYGCLFTDLANATSNHIYQALGYQAVCDMSDFLFESGRLEKNQNSATRSDRD
jgi:hypothetical protein